MRIKGTPTETDGIQVTTITATPTVAGRGDASTITTTPATLKHIRFDDNNVLTLSTTTVETVEGDEDSVIATESTGLPVSPRLVGDDEKHGYGFVVSNTSTAVEGVDYEIESTLSSTGLSNSSLIIGAQY